MTNRAIFCYVCEDEHQLDEQGIYVCLERSGAFIGDKDLYWSLHDAQVSKLRFTRRRIERARKRYNAARRQTRGLLRPQWDALQPTELAEMCVRLEKLPQRPKALSADFVTRMERLVTGTKVDLDEPIHGDVDLLPV